MSWEGEDPWQELLSQIEWFLNKRGVRVEEGDTNSLRIVYIIQFVARSQIVCRGKNVTSQR